MLEFKRLVGQFAPLSVSNGEIKNLNPTTSNYQLLT